MAMANNKLKYTPIVAVIDSGVAENCSYKDDICGGISLWIEGNDLILSDVYQDELGHGTQVCSTIKKICPDALLYIVKIYKHEEISSSYLLLQALEHLLTVDVNLINISLSVASTTFVNDIDKVLHKLINQNKVVISSVKNGQLSSYPACSKWSYGVLGVNDAEEVWYKYFPQDGISEIMVSKSPELVESIEHKQKWFSGNSKATAYMTGVLARIYENYLHNRQELKYEMIENILNTCNMKERHAQEIPIIRVINLKMPAEKTVDKTIYKEEINIEIYQEDFVIIEGTSQEKMDIFFNVISGTLSPYSGCILICDQSIDNVKKNMSYVNGYLCFNYLGMKKNKVEMMNLIHTESTNGEIEKIVNNYLKKWKKEKKTMLLFVPSYNMKYDNMPDERIRYMKLF